MRISIITVCYNASATLLDAVQSVLSQKPRNSDGFSLEYIIVDGASTDNSLDLLKPYQNEISNIISEPDNGLYDAMNKGIQAATGDVVGILNADDVYAHQHVLSDIAEAFTTQGIEGVYGDLNYVNPNDLSEVVRVWRSGSYSRGKFKWGWMPPHPALFCKKECYSKWGLFDVTLKSAADYELMLRFIHKNEMSLNYIPKTIVLMRAGGVSNASLRHRINAHKEDWKAWRMNGLKPNLFTLLAKPLRKLPQFLHKN